MQDGFLHVFNLPSGQFHIGEVKKTCGTQNLYYDANDTHPMRIEYLFSKLESKTSVIFNKISTAISDGQHHIDILEKDIHILFKFMNISLRRTEQYRNEVKNPYRENDFMFQRLFEASKKNGQSGDPDQFWLGQLLYLLETSHEDLLTDTETGGNAEAATYKQFVNCYTLRIWKASDGYEFFLNERLVDFEGDTQSCFGAEVEDTGPQLIWMTTEDFIHLVLPISPEVAIIFCDESRCWESPFTRNMHRLKIPYPQNSLLKNAPHKDIVNVYVPSERRGKKTWLATVAWRVNIGTLSREHHRILASYSLSHAKSFVVVRSRARFERAKRDLEVFGKDRAEAWKNQGFRTDFKDNQRQRKIEDEHPPERQERITRIIDSHVSAVAEVISIIHTTQEPLPRTKDSAMKSWLTIRTFEDY
jgi:hypothetical protein